MPSNWIDTPSNSGVKVTRTLQLAPGATWKQSCVALKVAADEEWSAKTMSVAELPAVRVTTFTAEVVFIDWRPKSRPAGFAVTWLPMGFTWKAPVAVADS